MHNWRISSACVVALALSPASFAAPQREALADLHAASTVTGTVPAWENDFVRVRYQALKYPPAERLIAESRPVVLYVKIGAGDRIESPTLLGAPRGGRLSWRAGASPVGVLVDILGVPPAISSLRDPEADPPHGSTVETEWDGGRLVVSAFEPMRYGDGTGPSPSVTVMLSDGVVDVTSRGVRRRMGVRAGDAFWFEARTRLTVVSDNPVGAAIVQVDSR